MVHHTRMGLKFWKKTGKNFILSQEVPTNFWELLICNSNFANQTKWHFPREIFEGKPSQLPQRIAISWKKIFISTGFVDLWWISKSFYGNPELKCSRWGWGIMERCWMKSFDQRGGKRTNQKPFSSSFQKKMQIRKLRVLPNLARISDIFAIIFC